MLPLNEIDDYIAKFPKGTRRALEEIRTTIRKLVPESTEAISYGMATFYLHGHYLLYLAGHKNHIGLYPVPRGNDPLVKAFAPYKTSGRGTIQFPLAKPMPLRLITRIVKFRVKESLDKAKIKKSAKKK